MENLQETINHKNMILLHNFLRIWAKKERKKDDINIFDQLKLPYPKSYKSAFKYYTTTPNLWCSHDVYLACASRVIDITGDPNVLRKCGHMASESGLFHKLKIMYKQPYGVTGTLNFMPIHITEWNKSKRVEVIKRAVYNRDKDKVIALYRFTATETVDINDTYFADDILLGIFEGIPKNFPEKLYQPFKKLPLGSARMLIVHHDPIELYSGRFFQHLHLRPHYKDNVLFVRDPNTDEFTAIGRQVIIEKDQLEGNDYYAGQYSEWDGTTKSKRIGTLITQTLQFKNEKICQKGLIMGGPYCIFEFECQATQYEKVKKPPFFFSFTPKRVLFEKIFDMNLKWEEEMKKKNKAYDILKYHTENLEDIVEERTRQLKDAAESLRQMDQVVMRVVSHGLGNWSASTIADTYLIEKALNNNDNEIISKHLMRLNANCGVAALSAIGLNYYCKKNIFIPIKDVVHFFTVRSHFSNILKIQLDELIMELLINGGIFMILSEIFQNAIKAMFKQNDNLLIIMEIKQIENKNHVQFTIKNKGYLKGYINIMNVDTLSEIPDTHQGGWICKKMSKDLGGQIMWSESDGWVQVNIILPIKESQKAVRLLQ